MIVRSITPSELTRFAAVGPHSLGTDGLAHYIQELWNTGSSKPERCFVVESDGHFIARLAYRGRDEEVAVTALYLPWDEDYQSVGKLLLHETMSRLQRQGVARLESFLTSEWPYVSRIRALFDSIGLALVQEKVRYQWVDDGQPIRPRHPLTYRSLAHVGDEAFIEAIRRVSVGTLDRLDQLQVAELGANDHARDYFNHLKNDFPSNPDWWLLAYTPSGDLVGQVIGVPFNAGGSIGYIGVVPEQRGHGYIHDLLAQGMVAMCASGLTSFVCDTDALNHPMRHAFDSRGYHHTGTVWVYRATIATLNL